MTVDHAYFEIYYKCFCLYVFYTCFTCSYMVFVAFCCRFSYISYIAKLTTLISKYTIPKLICKTKKQKQLATYQRQQNRKIAKRSTRQNSKRKKKATYQSSSAPSTRGRSFAAMLPLTRYDPLAPAEVATRPLARGLRRDRSGDLRR